MLLVLAIAALVLITACGVVIVGYCARAWVKRRSLPFPVSPAFEQVRTPFVGAVLVYHQSPNEEPVSGHRDHPCVVTKVIDPNTVNVKVLFDHAPAEDRTSQQFSQGHVGWTE